MAKNDAEFTIDKNGMLQLVADSSALGESVVRIPFATSADKDSPWYRMSVARAGGTGEAFLLLPTTELKKLGASAAIPTKAGLKQATLVFDPDRGSILKLPTVLVGSRRPGKEQEFKESSQNKAVSASAGRANLDLIEIPVAQPGQFRAEKKPNTIEVSKKNKQRLAMQMAKKNRI